MQRHIRRFGCWSQPCMMPCCHSPALKLITRIQTCGGAISSYSLHFFCCAPKQRCACCSDPVTSLRQRDRPTCWHVQALYEYTEDALFQPLNSGRLLASWEGPEPAVQHSAHWTRLTHALSGVMCTALSLAADPAQAVSMSLLGLGLGCSVSQLLEAQCWVLLALGRKPCSLLPPAQLQWAPLALPCPLEVEGCVAVPVHPFAQVLRGGLVQLWAPHEPSHWRLKPLAPG
ncbi:hypothetical protein HaLaN_07110 [Haematococcus lacustris]|uniref:Uncharacterized protein n=1 Tax=Haematococcus lacustris TaxID=44745 RepID=A0A699YYC9_HAELA|nr:hypothetical protein HaLaN_07110 [Haematococcus lacustris]